MCCLKGLVAYLRLNGVKAREHPVFIELTRVKQYFDKIKTAETPAAERNMAVDRAAAARFIKAGLVSQHFFVQAPPLTLFSLAMTNMIWSGQSNKRKSVRKLISDSNKHRRRHRLNERRMKETKETKIPAPLNTLIQAPNHLRPNQKKLRQLTLYPMRKVKRWTILTRHKPLATQPRVAYRRRVRLKQVGKAEKR
jgi:hypothetical protein